MLAPPAAPGETFKTLGQIEPRTDVQKLSGDATSVFLISNSGNYYLTADVSGQNGKAGIAIAANDVTLDLNGFRLSGSGGGTRGIELRGTSNVRIRNGEIRTWSQQGVGSTGSPSNIHLEDLLIANTTGAGIALPGNAANSVRKCAVRSAGATGIDLGAAGLVQGCVVEQMIGSTAAAMLGINAGDVLDSTVTSVNNSGGAATGIAASVAANSRVSSVTGSSTTVGINATTVTDCTVATINAGAGSAGGVSGSTVTGTTVSNVGTNATGANANAIGINAATVSDCKVISVAFGGSSSAATAVGITGESISNSAVSFVGSATTTSNAGINAANVTGCSVQSIGTAGADDTTGITSLGLVSACRVSSLFGANALTGIQADTVSHSSVSNLTQDAGASSSATGINAQRVADSQVTSVTGNSGSAANGISVSRNATGCGVTSIRNSGTGSAIGINTQGTFGARVESCAVGSNSETPTSTGIIISAGQALHNTVDGALTGISANNGSMVDGNNVTACPNAGVAASTNTLVVRNHFRGCLNPITSDATCQVGPSVNGVGVIASTSPWANFRD